MIRRTALLLLVAVLALAAPAAIASGGEGHKMGEAHGQKMLADLEANATRLGISDETMAKIRAIMLGGTSSAEGVRAELGEARAALRTLLSAPRPDEAAVMDQARRIGALETKLLELRLHTLLRVRPLLTDAQIEALQGLREQRFAPVREACRAEIAAACADAASGRETMHCLRAHNDQLSDACRSALAAVHADHTAP
jgi:Spy/CpxP family protein refolding chaperone